MFRTITPESAGIRSSDVGGFIRFLQKNGVVCHQLLLLKGDGVFGEFSWAPFTPDFCHRMYSQTKSFVGTAILLLADEGKLSLRDPVAKFFPDKIPDSIDRSYLDMTVEDMLVMETCCRQENWFKVNAEDRAEFYFGLGAQPYPSGLVYQYDSAGSQVLCVLAERLSGMKLLDYLKTKLFDKMGTFKNAQILRTANGDSWGDSALICTPRDVASFARLLMNGGVWEGERIMPERVAVEAVKKRVDNDETGFDNCDSWGYGYQIWRLRDGFWFRGMGGQFTVCLPEKDLICVVTGDNQGYSGFPHVFIAGLYEFIVDRMNASPLPEDPGALAELEKLAGSLKLYSLPGDADSPFRETVDGAKYLCGDNPMGIRSFALDFSPDGKTGTFRWENAQGEKSLPFALLDNAFAKFPQLGYSDGVGGQRTANGFMYDCAVSAAWREERKLLIKVQVIDRYFGNFVARFSFTPDGSGAALVMKKTAEDFLGEYDGKTFGVRAN